MKTITLPLHEASRNGHLDTVKYLTMEKQCGPSVSRNNNDNTPIHIASLEGHLEVVRFFISELNCDPNIPGEYRKTPLHLATNQGHSHITKYLVEEQNCNPLCLDEDNDKLQEMDISIVDHREAV